jgi:hypothetical protein
VHIPKGDGRTRPVGIPALEDKVVQQAARMVLEPIYEAMFIGFSYGYRPGRSQHGAFDALAIAIDRKVNRVLDADIRSFFDTIDHGWMKRFLEHRIGDKRMVRLLMKWMRAGAMEQGKLREVTDGTPQGGVIYQSPKRLTSWDSPTSPVKTGLGGSYSNARPPRKKRQAKLAELKEECRKRRHRAVPHQHRWLSAVLNGYYRHYAVPTNSKALAAFYNAVRNMWHRAFQRRTQKGRWTVARRQAFEQRFPPPLPRILHPWSTERFALR